MSLTLSAAPSARDVRSLINAAGAKLAGKKRGPDHGDDRRVPKRNSYEETDIRARPWRMVGDGSLAQGIIHTEVLIETADELRRQLWAEFPVAEIRRRRADRAEAAAELEQLAAASPAEVPIGRPATLRILIAKHDEWLEKAASRLRRIDVDVLRALLSFLDYASGRLFPAIATIAERAGVSYNAAEGAIRRLRLHGLIDRVRRTTRTGNIGEFGPQLEQTSNAYFFDHRRKMAARTWQTYWKRLCAALKRLGAKRPPNPLPSHGAATTPALAIAAPPTALQAALARLGASVTNATT